MPNHSTALCQPIQQPQQSADTVIILNALQAHQPATNIAVTDVSLELQPIATGTERTPLRLHYNAVSLYGTFPPPEPQDDVAQSTPTLIDRLIRPIR